MFYIQKDNKILFINEDKQLLINTLSFQPDLKEEDIKETNKEIVLYNNEYRFLEEIQEEYLTDLKKEIINELKELNKKTIEKEYSLYDEINISNEIGYTEEEIITYKEYINKCINAYNQTKGVINNKKKIETLREFDYEKYYNDLIINKE